jgi:hypothetical protein
MIYTIHLFLISHSFLISFLSKHNRKSKYRESKYLQDFINENFMFKLLINL